MQLETVGHKSTHDYTAALQEDAQEMVEQLTAAIIAEEQVYDSREAQLTEMPRIQLLLHISQLASDKRLPSSCWMNT